MGIKFPFTLLNVFVCKIKNKCSFRWNTKKKLKIFVPLTKVSPKLQENSVSQATHFPTFCCPIAESWGLGDIGVGANGTGGGGGADSPEYLNIEARWKNSGKVNPG